MAYKTIQESFWTDLKVKQLSPNEKLMFIYLITNPHAHYSGIYYLPIPFMSEEVGLPVESISDCVDSLEKLQFLRYDHPHSVVWIIKMCKYQMAQGGNPKVMKEGIVNNLSVLQSKELIRAFIEQNQFLNLTLCQGWRKVEGTLCQRSDTDTDIKPKNNRKPKTKKKEEDFKEKPNSDEEDKLPPDEIEVVLPLKPKANEVIKVYCDGFKDFYGINPYMTPKDIGIAKRLSEVPDILNLIGLFFKSQDQFILKSKHNIMIFESQINKLLVARVNVNYSGIKEWLQTKHKEV